MASVRVELARGDNAYYAEILNPERIREVFVSNARAERVKGKTSEFLVLIPLNVPRAAEWVVTRDHDSVYVSPPEGGLHWAKHTVRIVAPRGHPLHINDQM
jgi:hypothetical protein